MPHFVIDLSEIATILLKQFLKELVILDGPRLCVTREREASLYQVKLDLFNRSFRKIPLTLITFLTILSS